MTRKHAASNHSPGGTQFIEMGNPADKSWRHTVSSHAARRYYAKARQRHGQQLEKPGVDEKSTHQKVRTSTHRGPRELRADAPGSHLLRISETGTEPPGCDVSVYAAPEMLFPIRSVDPFDTLVRPTNRFESHLLDHYAKYVSTNNNVCEIITRRGSSDHWFQQAATDHGLLNAIFLSSCRSLGALCATGPFVESALWYKGNCIRLINDAISQNGPPITPATIATILAMASDDFLTGDAVAHQQHCQAVEIMVREMGGPQNFRGDEVFASLVRWVTLDPELQKQSHPGRILCMRIERLADQLG